MWRLLVNIGTLALVYFVGRFTLGVIGLVPDHAAPNQTLAIAVGAAIASQALFWFFTTGKRWGGFHLLNGLMTIIITAVSVVVLLRFLGVYEPPTDGAGANLLMIGLGLVLLGKLFAMGLLFLGVFGRTAYDPGGNVSQDTVDEEV
jgi:hypothetical protein